MRYAVEKRPHLDRSDQAAEVWIYWCFDFFLRSTILLPELTPVEAPGDPRSIVDVRLGILPEILPGGRVAEQALQITDNAVMLTVKNTARYLIRGGREIIVHPVDGGSERNVRLFLLGSALGI